MRRTVLSLSCLILVWTTISLADEKAEMKKLEGTWKVQTMQIGGEDQKSNAKMMIQGDKMTLSGFGPKPVINTFKMDVSKKPAEIDLTPSSKTAIPGKGIFKLEGNTLTLCVADDGKRPTEFVTKPKSTTVLMVLERVKE